MMGERVVSDGEVEEEQRRRKVGWVGCFILVLLVFSFMYLVSSRKLRTNLGSTVCPR